MSLIGLLMIGAFVYMTYDLTKMVKERHDDRQRGEK